MPKVQEDEIRRRFLRGERLYRNDWPVDSYYEVLVSLIPGEYEEDEFNRAMGQSFANDAVSYQVNPSYIKGALLLLLKGE